MKTPICEICAKTGALCSGCREKVEGGKMSELDVEISKLLYKINETHNINEASFVKALDLGRIILILTEGDVGILIGKDGKVVSELSQSLGKKVRIAEYTGDLRKSIADILTPARLVGLNKIYLGGKETYKVRLLKSEISLLPLDISTLEKVLHSLVGEEVRIIFE